MCSKSGEIGERAAHAERKHDDAHVLDRGIGEQTLDVAPPVQHEGREDQRDQAHRHHQGTGGNRGRVGGEQYLEAQQRIERDVQQQARQHGRYRRRTFGVRVRQPGMQRREADFGAVAEKQEYEGNIEKGRVEIRRALDQQRPDHAVLAFAHHRTRRHVDQDGAEQGERNSDAAQDEIFPGRFQRGVGAVDADHQHRRQRREFDRHPHQADIVRHEREIHAEHHGLIHGMVETQVNRRQPLALELMRDVARAEDAGGESDEGIEHDEDDVQIVDQHVRPGCGDVRPRTKRAQTGMSPGWQRRSGVPSAGSRAGRPAAPPSRSGSAGRR